MCKYWEFNTAINSLIQQTDLTKQNTTNSTPKSSNQIEY